MQNQQLVDYIKQATEQGQSKDQIKQALLQAGWQEKDIEEVFNDAKNRDEIISKQKENNIYDENKKIASNWYIAATYYLTAGFAIPFLFSLLFVVLVFTFFPEWLVGENKIMFFISGTLVGVLGTWLGVMYSAKYIGKKYKIEDKDKIVLFSILYLIVLTAIYYSYSIISGKITLGFDFFFYNLVPIIIRTLIFFIASKKYVK